MSSRAVMDTPANETKERTILSVAHRLFSQYGYKRTSVDDIASAAGIAKGTVYLYFESKEALFRSLCSNVVDTIVRDIDSQRIEPMPGVSRLGACLRAKFRGLFRVVNSAPHGRELVDSRDTIAADIFKTFNQRFESTIVELVEAAIAAGELQTTSLHLSPRGITKILLTSARGITSAAKDEADFERRFDAFLAIVGEGLFPRESRSVHGTIAP